MTTEESKGMKVWRESVERKEAIHKANRQKRQQREEKKFQRWSKERGYRLPAPVSPISDTSDKTRNDVADYIEAAIQQMREATERLEGDKVELTKAIMGVILDKTLRKLADSIRQNDLTIQDDTDKTIWTVETKWLAADRKGMETQRGN